MKLALTGAASTGKTTLRKTLVRDGMLSRHINVDARSLLLEMGERSVEDMSTHNYRLFQIKYIERKLANEKIYSDYITDRSFVDCFCYWSLYCARGASKQQNKWVKSVCFEGALSYDIHFFLPFGLIPFEDDGFRDRHIGRQKEVSDYIIQTLSDWEIRYFVLDMVDIQQRVKFVSQTLERL